MSQRLWPLTGQLVSPYIHGRFITPTSTQPIKNLINPVDTRKRVTSVHEATVEQVEEAWISCKEAETEWREDPVYRRNCLLKVADRIESNEYDMALIENIQTGKPIDDALYEMKDVVDCIRHFAGYSDKMFGQSQQWRNIEGHTVREPLGTVGLITSFNYPLLLTAWKLAPALAAGNCVIVKPAPQTPLSTLALASLASDILPAGVFNVLTGGTEIGEAMIDRVDKISFTGSTRVGQMIMQQASNKLTPVTLECGGKNAAIVCDDTHLRHAAEQVAMGAFSNAGQNCCAISRVLVQRKVYEPFLNELQMATAKWKAICDKEFHEEQEWYGPLIDDNQYRRVRSIIDGLDMKPFFEGHIQSSHGYFVPPTIYTGVQDDSYLATEELFAPVLSILNPFDEVDEAIHRVNQSKYGLAAGVFSNHMQTISKVSRYLKTGYIWVNQYNIMPPSLPFGGMKLSGIGKDLGQSGLNEFTVEKSIIGGFC